MFDVVRRRKNKDFMTEKHSETVENGCFSEEARLNTYRSGHQSQSYRPRMLGYGMYCTISIWQSSFSVCFFPADRSAELNHVVSRSMLFCKMHIDINMTLRCLNSLKMYLSFPQVCEKLGTIENDYFGLQYIGKKGEVLWLNLRNPINGQITGSLPIRLHLRVKFHVQPHLLLQEVTR